MQGKPKLGSWSLLALLVLWLVQGLGFREGFRVSDKCCDCYCDSSC